MPKSLHYLAALVLLFCASTSHGESKNNTPSPTLSSPNPQEERILILGDSHATGAFGQSLHQHLANLMRYHVYSYALCAATFETFLQPTPRTHCGHMERSSHPKSREVALVVNKPYPNHSVANTLDEHLTRFEPTVVVAEIGMNMGLLSEKELALALQHFITYLETKGIKKFVLIGPPTYYQANHIEAGFKLGLASSPFGDYISSLDFNRNFPVSAKLLHLPESRARKWGTFAFERLLPLLQTPPAVLPKASK